MTNIIPRRPERQPLRVTTIGANRGARASQGALIELAQDSGRAIELAYMDPVPGRAAALARVAEQRGVAAHGIESRIEDVADEETSLRVFQADRASATVTGLERDPETPAMGLIIVAPPGLDIVALRFTLGRRDPGLERTLAAYRGLAAVSSREGSGALFGTEAPLENRLTEGAFRNWFGHHVRRNAAKVATGLEPESPTMEATLDGGETRPVFVIESDELEPVAHRIAERVADEAAFPLRRDSAFLTVEIARFPEPMVRFRPGVVRRDRMVQVGRARDLLAAPPPLRSTGAASLAQPRPDMTERVARHEGSDVGLLLVAAIGLALASGPQSTATQRNPIATTD